MKKSQASIFLILGVVLVIIVIFYLLLTSKVSKSQNIGFEDVNIDMPIKACIDYELDNAILYVGYQGGYLGNIPNNSIESFNTGVAYWLYSGVYVAPSIEFIEQEIETFLKSSVLLCINSTITQSPIEVEQIEADVSIYDDLIVVDMDISALKTSGSVVRKTGRFTSNSDAHLGKMVSQAQLSIVEMIDSQSIPLTWLANAEFFTEIMEEDEGFIFRITDNSSVVKGEAYSLYYSISFAEPENARPVIFEEGPFFGFTGQELYIDYDAVDDAYEDKLYFSITPMEPYNEMVIDSSTGEIYYVPLRNGTYSAFVKVTDVEGLSDVTFLEVEVDG